MRTSTIKLDEPEVHHILAALQVYEDHLREGTIPLYAQDIATNGGDSIALFENDLLSLRESINFNGWDCQHQDHEDCMICCVCGECREDVDEDDYCPDCGDNPSIMECLCGEVFHIGEDGEWDEWNNHAQNCKLWMPDLS